MALSRQKLRRQDAILDAAEQLVREHGATNFSMLALSAKAELSPATPYNLFGNKASILYALLNRSLDGIFEGAQRVAVVPDPIDKVLIAAAQAGAFFVADPDYYRPLYQYLLGVIDPVHRPAYMNRALDYWRAALEGFECRKVLSRNQCDVLARGIVAHVVGVLDFWIHGDLDDDFFSPLLEHGVVLLIFHIADGDQRERLSKRMADLSERLRDMPPLGSAQTKAIGGGAR